MLKETIKYVDYLGVERTEDFYFNLNKAEVLEMQLSVAGGLNESLARIVAAKDQPEIVRVFKEIILKSYGEMSPDGKYFLKKVKGVELAEAFSQTEAYVKLYMKLATNDIAGAEFIKGIVPPEENK